MMKDICLNGLNDTGGNYGSYKQIATMEQKNILQKSLLIHIVTMDRMIQVAPTELKK
jgi:hypothetical protein